MPVNTRFHGRPLHLDVDGASGRFRAALPAGAAGAWCRLVVGAGGVEPWWAKLEAADEDRGQVVREAFLGRLHRGRDGPWRSILVHIPLSARHLAVQVFTTSDQPPDSVWARLAVLPRPVAVLSLLAHGWRVWPSALAGNPMGLPGRVRTMLGQAPARGGEMPPYAVWTSLYDRWGQAECDALSLHRLRRVRIAAVVVGGNLSDRAATLATLDAQWLQPVRTECIARPAAFVAGIEAWVLVLQAGERVPPHALACFAQAALHRPNAYGFYADADVRSGTTRSVPLLKPQPDPWLLGSGLLTSGGCLFRTGVAAGHGDATDAAAWRLSIASSARAPALKRIPLIITHLPAPAPVFRNVSRHAEPAAWPPVSMVIPSAAQSGHALRCVRQLVTTTSYPDIEVLVAVSHLDTGNASQARVVAALQRLPCVRVIDLGMGDFNYAAVNNAAERQATGELLLLVNDDVVPMRPDWLRDMVAFIGSGNEARADIVGPRLLYGNDTVQHGGVIVGLANLCEHAFRLAPRNDLGPHGIAKLNRQVSAVTGGCMLLRRSLYKTLGGLDESFVIALNDVDLCLRAGAAGARIVLAAEVELYHYESLSLGRHYKGSRAVLEAVEVGLLRQRWASMIDADPFYSPSASLMPGHEFQPGFPSRCSPLSWTRGEMPLCG